MSLPTCMIVDIDGTVAQRVDRDPHDETRVCEDEPRSHVIAVIQRLYFGESSGHDFLKRSGFVDHLFFLSGRNEKCREATSWWLHFHMWTADSTLLMRGMYDQRSDEIVKEELYRTYIEGRYEVKAIFDDRHKVCEMWTKIGLGDRLFRVGTVNQDNF